MSNSIYKTAEAEATLMALYQKRLASLNIETQPIYATTFAGKTHILAAGDPSLPALVVLHGIHAGAPLAMEAIGGLASNFRVYAIDTIGQATKSAPTRLPLKGSDYGKWLSEVMEQLELSQANFIGVSYGGFLLQKLIGALVITFHVKECPMLFRIFFEDSNLPSISL